MAYYITITHTIIDHKLYFNAWICILSGLIIIPLCSCIPLAVYINAQPLLLLLGQDPEISRWVHACL